MNVVTFATNYGDFTADQASIILDFLNWLNYPNDIAAKRIWDVLYKAVPSGELWKLTKLEANGLKLAISSDLCLFCYIHGHF